MVRHIPKCAGALAIASLLSGCTVMSFVGSVTQGTLDAVTPIRDIQVQLPDGAVIPARATRALLSGRTLVDGKPPTLTCKVLKRPYDGLEHGYAECVVVFPRLADGMGIDRRGRQPEWFLGASQDGRTPESLLTLSRPLRWVNGVGL